MQRIIQPFLVLQLHDLRTSVVKETCGLIVWIAQEFPEEFSQECQSLRQQPMNPKTANPHLMSGGNGVNYFKDDAIPKLLTSANKVLQELGHQSIKGILEGGPLI